MSHRIAAGPVHRGARRLAAGVAILALGLPSLRGPLCTAGGHDGTHVPAPAGMDHPGSHAHGEPAGPDAGRAADPTLPVLDEAGDPRSGCHALMACGTTLVGLEGDDVYRVIPGPIVTPASRALASLHSGLAGRPALPPPKV